MTWDGHEFLDDIRSDSVWSQTKSAVVNQVGSVSLSVLQEVAKGIVKGLVGLP